MATPSAQAPTNLILYGPPGTGKTYQTAREAVSLCGSDVTNMTRQQVMSAYQELVARKRIEFITFHQSYTYEDFIEGLRPETSAVDGTDQNESGGFRLVPRPGIFRTLAERAQTSRGSMAKAPDDLSHRQAFKMSLGRSANDEEAYLFQEAIENGYVLLGYGGEVDWSDPKFDSFEEIKSRWREVDPKATGQDPNVQQTFALRSYMQTGDLVIVSDGNKQFRAIGMVTGPYRFVKREHDHYYHQRPVKWLWSDMEGLPREDIYERGFSQVSIYKLDDSAIKWPALSQIVSGGQSAGDKEPDAYVLIIDEINRGNVSKVFGELITLIEPDKRLGQLNELTVTLPYSGKSFGVPANLHIIGTMNTADRSIALLDTALRRRFQFRELLPNPSLLGTNIESINLRAALTGLNRRIEYLFDRDHQIGHAYFMDCKNQRDINQVMRDKVIPLLIEYFYEDWEKVRSALNEVKDAGAFITRVSLHPPLTVNDSDTTTERWRYTVNQSFDVNAYEKLAE